MHGVAVAPEAEQRHARLRQLLDRRAPDVLGRRRRAARGDDAATLWPFLAMSLSALMTFAVIRAACATCWNQATSGAGR